MSDLNIIDRWARLQTPCLPYQEMMLELTLPRPRFAWELGEILIKIRNSPELYYNIMKNQEI